MRKKDNTKTESRTAKEIPLQEGMNWSTGKILFAILAITLAAFSPALKNGFVSWDDPTYILNNPFIKGASFKTFFTQYYAGNYHPFTMISLAIEHHFAGIKPFLYHFDNLLLHLLNTTLVFFFVHLLFERKKIMIAGIAAVLFGIHPMHVESVAWVSERKDVLYSTFFLSGLISYLKYIERKRAFRYLGLAFLLFTCSLFSKGQAVVFPLILLLIDYLQKRKIHLSSLLEKLPFFALSILFGVIALKAQASVEAVSAQTLSFSGNIFWGSYSLVMYLIDCVLPIDLSGVHPYPFAVEGGIASVPAYARLSFLIFIVLGYFLYRNYKKNPVLSFGLLFFLVCIFPVLKFIPVGDAIVSERYTYISYIGLFIMAGFAFDYFIASGKYKAQNIYILTGAAILLFSGMTFSRTKVWKNSTSFWEDVCYKYPGYWRGFHRIGEDYIEKGNYEMAAKYFTKAVEGDAFCPPVARHDLGFALYKSGQYPQALKAFNDLLAIDSTDAGAYMIRGLIYSDTITTSKEALADYTKSIALKPDNAEAYLNRGVLYTDMLGKYELGIADFKHALKLDSTNAEASINLGIALYKLHNYEGAIQQYSKILRGSSDNCRVLYLRALTYSELHDYPHALNDALKVKSLGIAVEDSVITSWRKLGERVTSPKNRRGVIGY